MENVRAFVTNFAPAAYRNERAYGVPALLTLAQAALESGWGKFAPGFNFFGVKADKSWTGPKQRLRTREVIRNADVFMYDDFRKYASADASFADHADFLKKWPRYKKVFETKDPREAARAVAAAGYATDPNYANALIRIMDLMEQSGALPKQPPGKEPITAMSPILARSTWLARLQAWLLRR